MKMVNLHSSGARHMPYWWSPEIAELRKRTISSRRRVTRMRRRSAAPEDLAAYKEHKKTLRSTISRTKRKCWDELIGQLECDVYGEAYTLVKRAANISHPSDGPEKDALRDTLFPSVPPTTSERQAVTEEIPTITTEEIKRAAARLKNKRAPGEDGNTAEAVKIAVEVIGETFAKFYNDLLRRGSFPGIWKTTRVVLIEKPIKNDALRSYRPLCLISTLRKLFKRIVADRIDKAIEERGVLSDCQHGFRSKHSTIDAIRKVIDTARDTHRGTPSKRCVLALIDVKNAFNSA